MNKRDQHITNLYIQDSSDVFNTPTTPSNWYFNSGKNLRGVLTTNIDIGMLGVKR